MPLSSELLHLLRCPETRQRLRAASAEEIAGLEKKRASGELRNRAGELAKGPIEEGLVREDGTFFYPIRDGIPLLRPGDAIGMTN